MGGPGALRFSTCASTRSGPVIRMAGGCPALAYDSRRVGLLKTPYHIVKYRLFWRSIGNVRLSDDNTSPGLRKSAPGRVWERSTFITEMESKAAPTPWEQTSSS